MPKTRAQAKKDTQIQLKASVKDAEKKLEESIKELKKFRKEQKKIQQALNNVSGEFERIEQTRRNVEQTSERAEVTNTNTSRNLREHSAETTSWLMERAHHHRSLYIQPYMTISPLLTLVILCFYQVSWPVLLGGVSAAILLGTFADFWRDTSGCDAAINYQSRESDSLLSAEILSFQAGVRAAKSYKGLLYAWATQETYYEYNAYCAAKHLAQSGNDNEIEKILNTRNTP